MKYFITLLITLFYLSAFAQQRQTNSDHSLLWCISGNGLSQPSFLFGTEHLICTDNYVWKSYMQECFARCKKLCTELDLSNASLPSQIANIRIDETRKELRSYYKSDDYQVVRRYFLDSIGKDLDTMQHYNPFFLQAIVIVKIAHCDSIVSYELRLMQKARSAGMKITGLETVKDQSDAIDSTSPESAARYLLLAAAAENAAIYEYNKMQTDYNTEDIQALYNMMRGMTSVLDNRNKKWIPEIKKMIHSNSVFFAVGAGHLWGDQGVISLLRNEGYSVIPIKKGLDTYPCNTESHTVNGKMVTTVTFNENKPFKDNRNFTDFEKRSHINTFEIIDQYTPLAGYDVAAYMQNHLQIPAGHTSDMDDMVTVVFDLNSDGKIEHVTIKQGIGVDYDTEALRMVKNMPHWKQGAHISAVIMPVVFRKREKGE